MLFSVAFKDEPHDIYIRYRTSGKMFKQRRIVVKTSVQNALIREFLYTDDWDLYACS